MYTGDAFWLPLPSDSLLAVPCFGYERLSVLERTRVT
eukprot:COSAG01_NODE_54108_length_334_cov_0.885106_1_plen_36_part_01